MYTSRNLQTLVPGVESDKIIVIEFFCLCRIIKKVRSYSCSVKAEFGLMSKTDDTVLMLFNNYSALKISDFDLKFLSALSADLSAGVHWPIMRPNI